LPIDASIAGILAALRAGRDVVLEAPPGSGKTTRVPPAIAEIDAPDAPDGRSVLVLEPRRIAARLAARRVASERGERVGESVGYHVRFERAGGKQTRLWFLTEGLLTRRLLGSDGDAELQGVSAVVFDEFHERSLHADLGLGLVREIQSTLREDLRIVVMSATLDGARLSRELDAELIRAEGRPYPVEVEHDDAGRKTRGERTRVAAQTVEGCVRLLLREVDRRGGRLDGDALVFLPGVGEIRRVQERLKEAGQMVGFDVVPLFGDQTAEQQERAVQRGPRPRVVLATNVAETSVTLDGINLVIDGGVARVARFDPRTGVNRLELERISMSSAQQRAGRAGRQGPGRCLRLYSAGEAREMRDSLEPEVERVDLCEAVLLLKSWGTQDVASFAWVTPPPRARLQAAEQLLQLLGAVHPDGEITVLGRRLVELPVHPRVGRMLVEARGSGHTRDGALLAALCQARPIGRSLPRVQARSDLLVLRDLFEEGSRLLDPRWVRSVSRERDQLERLSGVGRSATAAAAKTEPSEDDLLRCIAAGFPDRLCRRRAKDSNQAVSVGGFGVELAESSVCTRAGLFVAVDAISTGGSAARVTLASEVDPMWLDALFPGQLHERDTVTWNADKQRAEGIRSRVFFDLAIDERRIPIPPGDPEAGELVAKAAVHPRFIASMRTPEVENLLLRIAMLRGVRPDPAADSEQASDDALIEHALRQCATGCTSLEDVRRAPFTDLVMAQLGGCAAQDLRRLVPERIRIPSGREARITYRRGQSPMISAKLQEFFGARESPRIMEGRVTVAVDLLAPNGRSVQITEDLAGFWKTLYPKERRELARRYPRHPWPEDPFTATPTHRPLPRK